MPILFGYFEGINSTENFVIIFTKGFVTGDADTRKIIMYDSYEELIPEIKKYFPKIDSEEISKAIKYFKQFQVLPETTI